MFFFFSLKNYENADFDFGSAPFSFFCRDLPFQQTAHSGVDVGAPESRNTTARKRCHRDAAGVTHLLLLFLPLFSAQWREIRMPMGTSAAVQVLQACRGDSWRRTIFSRWMERGDARRLLMDVTFTQEAEPDAQPHPLQVYLSTSDTPTRRFVLGGSVAELHTEEPFPQRVREVSRYLRNRTGLDLGPVLERGFQLAFSYSGTCVLLTSVRLYYRRCPDVTEQLVSFRGAAADSTFVPGSCVAGAAAASPPTRECAADGSWGPLWGHCSCRPGHQPEDGSCRGAIADPSQVPRA